jgi:hypothetical protein
MEAQLKKICFLNGSMRGKQSSSVKFLNEVSKKIDSNAFVKEFITVGAKGNNEKKLKVLIEADILVLSFPLYSYCLPGALIQFLEEFYQYNKQDPSPKQTVVYVIVNCAYADPKINAEAIRVVKNFCARVGFSFKLAISIGCGLAVLYTKSIDIKLHRAMEMMASDIMNPTILKKDILFLKPILPRIIMDTVRMRLDRNALEGKNIEKNKH